MEIPYYAFEKQIQQFEEIKNEAKRHNLQNIIVLNLIDTCEALFEITWRDISQGRPHLNIAQQVIQIDNILFYLLDIIQKTAHLTEQR